MIARRLRVFVQSLVVNVAKSKDRRRADFGNYGGLSSPCSTSGAMESSLIKTATASWSSHDSSMQLK
jgi:hypothetical protein